MCYIHYTIPRATVLFPVLYTLYDPTCHYINWEWLWDTNYLFFSDVNICNLTLKALSKITADDILFFFLSLSFYYLQEMSSYFL